MWANAFWDQCPSGDRAREIASRGTTHRAGWEAMDRQPFVEHCTCTQREEGTSPARRTYEATLLLRRLEAPLDRARRVAQLGQRVGPARGRLQSRGPDEAQREQNLLKEDHGVCEASR